MTVIAALKWLFLTSEPVIWIFTNPFFFLTAPLFVLWFQFLIFLGKAGTISLPFKPYFKKGKLGDGSVGLYIASWKCYLNKWFGWFPKATFPAIEEYFGLTP